MPLVLGAERHHARTPPVDQQIADQARTHGVGEAEVPDSVLLRSAALKRLVEPDEVAEAVAFLCSPQAVNGTRTGIVLDGGWTARKRLGRDAPRPAARRDPFSPVSPGPVGMR